jgi:hypothetical protein
MSKRKRKGASKAVPRYCRICRGGRMGNKLQHKPNCSALAWERIHAEEPERRSREQAEKRRAALEEYRRKKRIGPPIPHTAPKQAKAHPQGAWPPIIGGGAVETNRRRH